MGTELDAPKDFEQTLECNVAKLIQSLSNTAKQEYIWDNTNSQVKKRGIIDEFLNE